MDIFEELVKKLMDKEYMISAAESCTGGLFAAGLVDVPAASKVLSASFVTYSEWAKSRFAFVSEETIRNFGVVSEQVAKEMAAGAAKNALAQVGVGITGFAGPSGGDRFAERGTVCFGFYVNGELFSHTLFLPELSRNPIRQKCAAFAAERLLELLK